MENDNLSGQNYAENMKKTAQPGSHAVSINDFNFDL